VPAVTTTTATATPAAATVPESVPAGQGRIEHPSPWSPTRGLATALGILAFALLALGWRRRRQEVAGTRRATR
jgi:hypothetical protein